MSDVSAVYSNQEDKELYRRLLEITRCHGIVVIADPNLKKTKNAKGHWHDRTISIFREHGKEQLFFGPAQLVERVSAFVDGAQNVSFELAVFLHELGHWCCQHTDPNPLPEQKCKDEMQAWEVGKFIGRVLGMRDFTTLEAEWAGARKDLGCS